MEPGKALRILMLEDNPHDIFIIERVLMKGDVQFESQRVDERESFIKAIQSFQPDVILSDHRLPDFNSREALKISLELCPTVPFILVTGSLSDENALACLRDGADDYVLKENLSRLPAAISRSIKVRRLNNMRKQARITLRKQNAELVKVTQELDRFVYSVSHNLRGPLASVIGLLNLAESENDRAQLRSLHDFIRNSVNRLDHTLKDIQSFALNATSDIESRRISWEEQCQAIYSDLDHVPGFSRSEFSVEVIDQGTDFYTDPGRFGIIMKNVYLNAIQWQRQSHRHHIQTRVLVSEHDASISVTDNGVGIREEVLPRVFEMFFRGNEDSDGAGLGLYIVLETVKKLGGSIDIRSVPGQETEVTITLPNRRKSTSNADL